MGGVNGRVVILFGIGAIVFLIVSGCHQNSAQDHQPIVKKHLSMVSKMDSENSKNVNKDVRILRVGNTDFYIPISWLYYNRMLPNRRSLVKSPFIQPPFSDENDDTTVHKLGKEPQGFRLRIANESVPVKPVGVDPRSAVYEISFEIYPSDQDMNDSGSFMKLQTSDLREIRRTKAVNGWVKFNKYYYDIAYDHAKILLDLPRVGAPGTLNAGSAAWRYSDNLVIGYRWMYPGTNFGEPDTRVWRDVRNSVGALISWLALPPGRRATDPNFLVGGIRANAEQNK